MRRAARRLLMMAGVGVAVGAGCVLVRGFLPLHGLIVGAAAAALVYSIYRAADRLREQRRRL